MRVIWWFVLLLLASCLDVPEDGHHAVASRVIVVWDPLACGTPHRVVLELEHDDGTDAAMSAPCALGSFTLDLPQWGIYSGRYYGWELGEPLRAVAPVTLTVDAPLIRWELREPP